MGDWAGDPFRLGDFLVEPRRNLVTGPRGSVTLQPKIIDLLCYLSERHGQVVSREELVDRVWGVEFGADESLTRAISQLRKAFDDSREQPRIIETIAKRGYRLLPAPKKADQVAGAKEVGAEAGRSTRGRRPLHLAVAGLLLLCAVATLAFILRSSPDELAPVVSDRTGIVLVVGPFDASGADGFGEDLAAEIARSPLVRVRAPGVPAPAGEKATIGYRLRGHVRPTGSVWSVNAQLLDQATGELLWSGDYSLPGAAGSNGRSRVLGAIAAESLLPLLRSAKAKIARRPILSLLPWELTLLVTSVPGDEVRPTGPPHEDSYWLQRRALELDSDFAPAHALFAQLAGYHALFHPPANAPEAVARARRHAVRALELAPYDAEVLYQLGLYHRFVGDRARAEALFMRVAELQPNHPLARMDLAFVRGQCSDAAEASIAEIEQAASLLSASNPVRWVALSHLSNLHLTRGDFDRARDAAIRSRQIVPLTMTAMPLAAADAALGREEEALAVLAEHRREWPQMDVGYFSQRVVPRWCLGGDRRAAVQQAFARLAATAIAQR